MPSIFLDALLQLGIPAGVAQVVNEQFAKVESNAAHLAGLQQELAQMGVQMDGLQLQVQLVAKRRGNNHVSTTTLEHMAQRLEQELQGLTAHMDGLAAAGIGAGLAAAQQPGGLPAAVKLEKPKPYSGQMEDPAVLDAFIYACKLYFQLAYMTLDMQQATLALLWLEGDVAVWW